MAEKKTRGHDRTRVWSAIVYPESAPSNWRDFLDEEHIEWAESPLHEFDTNLTGELKKPHWHIVICFEGPKSFDQVKQILDPLNCPIPQRCHALKGAVRYFAHLDNPEKYQYCSSDIIGHGGFDVAAALTPTSGQRYDLISEMMDFVKEHCIVEPQDLFDYARTKRREDWFPLLCDNSSYVLTQYIKSQRHRDTERKSMFYCPSDAPSSRVED